MSTDKPLCFVLMPFGKKPDPTGGPLIDFDVIYQTAIKPAIIESGLEPIRADQEQGIGIIHKAMFERLLLCEFAIADLTTANANVFYELGVRHAGKSNTTLAIYANTQPIPFDLNFIRSLPYDIGENNSFEAPQANALKEQLLAKLKVLQQNALTSQAPDSPIFQLIEDWTPSEISHVKTDVFRDRATLQEDRRGELISARAMPAPQGITRLEALEEVFKQDGWVDIGSAVDLFLSYRAFSAWQNMITLFEGFPIPFQHQIMLREQYALALNRRASTNEAQSGDRESAIDVLERVIKEQGNSPETLGLLGRIFKDQWSEQASIGGRKARVALNKAISAYKLGFESDWRDYYPGINALTLMFLSGDQKHLEEMAKLLPLVKYAVERNMAKQKPSYWDHATVLELAIIENNEQAIDQTLDLLLEIDNVEAWCYQTTKNNIEKLRDALIERNEDCTLLDEVIQELEA